MEYYVVARVRERGPIEAIDSFDCGKRLSVHPSNGLSVRPFELSTVSETTPTCRRK